MNCKNCGYNNDDNAKFCERCGSNLNNQKNDINKTKNNNLFSWWDKRDSKGKLLLITLSLLVFIIVVSSFTSGKRSYNEETVKIYGSDNGTFYSGDFFSFSHRKMDNITLGDNSSPSSESEIFFGVADPKSSGIRKDYSFVMIVYKPETANKSAYEYITSDKNVNDATDTPTYPIKSIEIASVTGYQYDYDWNSKQRDIFFVKNGLLYKIKFMTDLNKMDNYQQDINTIVNSFTVK